MTTKPVWSRATGWTAANHRASLASCIVKLEFEGRWSVWVSGNWRLTFAFDGEDAVLVDYQDYH